MLIGDIPPTPWDIHFSIGPYPVRISPFFWIAAFVLSGASDGTQMLVGTMAVLASILIHELGHCLAMSHYGIQSHIVLYHMGGLAIPDVSYRGFGRSMSRGPQEQIVISAAGPLIQMTIGGLAVCGLALGGFNVGFAASYFPSNALPIPVRPLPIPLQMFFAIFTHVSIFWALVNLVPVYPLDGGQIARQIMILMGQPNAIHNSLILSIGAGVLVALFALQIQQTYMALLFGMLAYSSYQQLQGYGPRW